MPRTSLWQVYKTTTFSINQGSLFYEDTQSRVFALRLRWRVTVNLAWHLRTLPDPPANCLETPTCLTNLTRTLIVHTLATTNMGLLK